MSTPRFFDDLAGTITSIEDGVVTSTESEYLTSLKVGSVVSPKDDPSVMLRVQSVISDTQFKISGELGEETTELMVSDIPEYIPDVDLPYTVLVSTADAKSDDGRALGFKTPGWANYKEVRGEIAKIETLVAFKGEIDGSGNIPE